MATAASNQNDRYLRLFINSVIDYAIISLDPDGNVAQWNLGAERLKGYTAEEIMGKHFSTFYTQQDREDGLPEKLLAQALSNGHVEHTGWRQRKDGTLFWGDVVISAVRDEDGTLLGFAKMTRDLTERKRSEEREHELAANLERANRLKSEFLANMSHEVRTPLNGVLGMLALLLKSDLNDQQRDFAQTAAASSEALLRIVNDILDFSKIEAGRLELETVEFSLSDVLRGLRDLFEPQTRSKNLQLRIMVDDAIPQTLLGDPGRVRQVLANLLGNAVKFTTEGSVVLSATLVESIGNQVRIALEVADTGIGISEEDQRRILDAFSQADLSTTRRFGGTGLGLTISKQLADLMNGNLNISSTQGNGSKVSITITFGVAEAPPVTPQVERVIDLDEKTATGQRILIVEDNEINQKVTEYFLQNAGYTSDTVANGQEALDILEKNNYAAILMDCHMPIMDGFEATKRIRSIPGPTADIPIIALTASALPEERAKCFEAGMNDFIAKPLSLEHMRTVIAHLIAKS